MSIFSSQMPWKLARLLWVGLFAFASAVAPVSPGIGQTSGKEVGAGGHLGNVQGPGAPHRVAPSHLVGWMPFSGAPAYDASQVFWTGSQSRTAVLTVEVPLDVTAVQAVFANTSAQPYVVAGAAAAGSSQLGIPGYAGTTPGLTPYAADGATANVTPILFADRGQDRPPGSPGAAPDLPVSRVAAPTAAGAATLRLTGASCPDEGSALLASDPTGNGDTPFEPATRVASCNATGDTLAVELSDRMRSGVRPGLAVRFAPLGIVVPASPSPPEPNLVFSDWTEIRTPPRRDGPLMPGVVVLDRGIPLAGTITSTTATSAVLSRPLAMTVPAGTTLQACQTGVLGADLVPTRQLRLAEPKAGTIVAGMLFWPKPDMGPRQWDWPGDAVARSETESGHASVTATAAFPGSLYTNSSGWSRGTRFAFGAYATVVSVDGDRLEVDDAAKLSAGLQIFQGTGGLAAGYPYTGKVLRIDGRVLTMSLPLPAGVAPSMPLLFYLTAETDLAVTIAKPEFAIVPRNVVPGMRVVSGFAGASFPPDAIAYDSGDLAISQQPDAVIPKSARIYFCKPVVTSAASPAGQTSLHAPTAYPNHLVTVRINYGSAGAMFWSQALNYSAAVIADDPGRGALSLAYRCSVGQDGVARSASIGNETGGCEIGPAPIWALKFFSPQSGYTLAVVGDSHFDGNTTAAGSNGFIARAAALLDAPAAPVTYLDLAWGAQSSKVYAAKAMAMIRSVRPSVVVIQYTTANDPPAAVATHEMTARASAIAHVVQEYGGLAILASDTPRQTYGCTSDTAANTKLRLAGQAELNVAAGKGEAVIDLPPLIGGEGDALFFAPWASNDCLHGNDAANAAIAARLAALVRPFLGR